MTWDDVRRVHPESWLLIEALQARTEHDRRLIDDLSVVGVFADSPGAMRRYQELHAAYPQREYYVVHSSRARLDITDLAWVGIR